MTDQSSEDGQHTFGIGAVARMTGLTDHTIRVWERRYNAVVANRADNGRRIYLPADVEKLQLLKLLTENGVSIGKVAGESLESLNARVDEMRALVTPSLAAGETTVAVLGELLPTLLRTDSTHDQAIELLASGSQEPQLLADLNGRTPDVLIVELPMIGPDTLPTLERLRKDVASPGIVVVYGFARSRDAQRLRDAGVQLLRAPVTVEEAVSSISRAAQGSGGPATKGLSRGSRRNEMAVTDLDGPIEPRIFSQQQLSMLARQSSAIDCECPQHLADLTGALSAFEVYSANCASVSKEDEALHRYLHRTTARARHLIEQALERVAREEGLL